MSIMELGALGEFVGSVGVIATLIYLAIQIRQNTSATRAGVRQGVTEQANQYISMGLDNRLSPRPEPNSDSMNPLIHTKKFSFRTSSSPYFVTTDPRRQCGNALDKRGARSRATSSSL